MLVVLRAGDAVPSVAERRGEFFRWIREGVADAWARQWSEVDLRDMGTPLPHPQQATAYIITGSAHSVTEKAAWMLRAQAWLREATALGAPILGICFGHQLLAEALGGRVVKNPRGRQIGTVRVTLEDGAERDIVFSGLPREIHANATHVDVVVERPPSAEILASTPLDPHAAFRVRRAYGVQFHPEIDGDLMRGYLVARREAITSEGLPFDDLLASVKDAPHATTLMRSFVRWAQQPPLAADESTERSLGNGT
jgi:GMP synthase (glutamine-hydrolysing)